MSAGGVWKPAERPASEAPLLLDTHVWVWLLNGDATRMGAGTIPLLQKAAASQLLYACDISFWEVAMKAAAGKLVFSLDSAIWLQQAERAPGIVYLPLDRPILIQSTRLEKEMHGDPADRMHIAAAQLHSAALVTADKQIIAYAKTTRRVSVCDVRK